MKSSSASASESAVIAPPAALLPAREERLKDVVEQLAAFLRAQARLVVALLVEAQHARRKVLERTIDVALDVADRVDLRLARTSRAVVDVTVPGRSPDAQFEPRVRLRAPRRSERRRLVRVLSGSSGTFERQPARLEFLKKGRARHDGVVLEREGRYRHPPARKAEQIVKPRPRRGAPVGFVRPSELRQERRRIEDAAPDPLGPVLLDESDESHLVDVGVGRCRRIEQQHAVRPGTRRERLTFNPSAHGALQTVDAHRRVVEP